MHRGLSHQAQGNQGVVTDLATNSQPERQASNTALFMPVRAFELQTFMLALARCDKGVLGGQISNQA
jgi:hypothetical protein